jgi:hypothetical protein
MPAPEQPAAAAPPAPGIAAALERALLQHLRCGLFWVVTACGLYVTLTLALLQTRHPEAFKEHPLSPVSRVLLVVEGALLVTALLMAQVASRPAADGAGPPQRRLYSALAGGVMVLLQFALLITPLLVIYNSPELAAKGIAVPLMMLQRGVLLCMCALAAYHLLLALQLQLRLPAALAFAAVLALYLWGSYELVRLSLGSATFSQLNDVFYWNQLPLHIDTLPRLGTERIVDRIDQAHFGYYASLGLVGCIVTLLLWIPGAMRADSRETRRKPNAKVSPGRN